MSTGLPFDIQQRRRRRRRRAVGGGLIAIIAGAFGLWRSRSGGGRSWNTSQGCSSDEVRIDGRCVNRRIASGGKVDLNVASAEELAAVPGIGPELAAGILSERNRLGRFESFEQLDKVPGIGPAKLQALQTHAVIR